MFDLNKFNDESHYSNGEVSGPAECVYSDFLLEVLAHVVSGGDSLEVALSEAVLLVAGEAGAGAAVDVVHAGVEAAGERADFQLGVEPPLILIQVLLLVLVEEHVLKVQQLVPRAEETVAVVVIRRIGHCVLRITDERLDLLRVFLAVIRLATSCHLYS